MFDQRREKPGSGRLAVSVNHEGPTRVLLVEDMSGPRRSKKKPITVGNPTNLVMSITLEHGIALSLVNAQLHELVYARFYGVVCRLVRHNAQYRARLEVFEIQVP